MNKSVLITGAAGNLGKAVLQKFLQQDYRVAACVSDRHKGDISTTARVRTYPVDLSDEGRVQGTVSQIVHFFGDIEMAVLAAGGFAMGSLADTGREKLDKMYHLNFSTAYHMARQVFLQMRKQEGGGQIVFIGSRPALDPEAARAMISYAFSKSLVFRLAEVINAEGKKSGITASVIVPGIIDTPQNREAMPDADHSNWVSAMEIADNIFYLTTPAGRQLKESILKMYGGSRSGD
jgi:NAD(P)-dependent dehydrogenase (short-subunit alcohol dehydrogenase family)